MSLQIYKKSFNEYAFSPPIIMAIVEAGISHVLHPITIHTSFDLYNEGKTPAANPQAIKMRPPENQLPFISF